MLADFKRVKDIFLAAVEKASPVERAACLQEACGEDLPLRQQIEALLCQHEAAGNFLEPPAAGPIATVDEPIREGPGTIIGPYKLVEQIGEGGFGLVFLAEQQQPVRRKVALKILKPGMDSRQVIARFEAERQALALMDHPNIARVLDAGETASGRPHFVMELVRGVPITDYCDQNRLPLLQRLELFATVCQAVQHAHHKGIIHRDIKPSNVMVTLHDGVPVVKVIDFGIAKALGQQLTDKTLVTGFAQMVGTPLYMSPEQAQLSGLDIDTRSDIYSLGVLLYELLTGRTPFDKERLSRAGYDEMRRIIREEEPPRPSSRLSTLGQAAATVSERRRTDPKRLSQLLRGELDWIAIKALDKDRTRRYESASAFAADVERYLRDEAVLACPPSAWYRCRKFMRRHKTGLRIAALLLLVVGVVSGLLWDQARRRTELSDSMAKTEQTRLTELSKSMAKTEQTVSASLMRADQWRSAALMRTDQWHKQAGEATSATSQQAGAILVLWQQAEAALVQAESALGTGTPDDRLRQRVLAVRQQIGQQLALAQQTANLFRGLDDARLMRAIPIGTHFNYARAAKKFAETFAAYGLEVKAGQMEELARRIRAEQPAIREALIVALDYWRYTAAAAQNTELANQLSALAAAVDDNPWRQQFRTAAPARDATALRALSAQARRLSLPPSSLELLANNLDSRGDRDEALALLRWARNRHPTDFWIPFVLGGLLGEGKDKSPAILEEAIGCYRTALALRPEAGAVYNNLGNCLYYRRHLEEARTTYSKAIDLDPNDALAHHNLGNCLKDLKHLEEASAAYSKAIDLDPKYALAYYHLGLVRMEQKKIAEAEVAFRATLRRKPDYAAAHGDLGVAYFDQNKFQEAERSFRKAIWLETSIPVSLSGFDALATTLYLHLPTHAKKYANLGNALSMQGKFAVAVAEYQTAIRLQPDYAKAHYSLAFTLQKQGKVPEAVAEYRTAISCKRDYLEALENLGSLLFQEGKYAEAAVFYQRAIDVNPDRPLPFCHLGFACMQQGKFQAAAAAFRQGHALGSQRRDWKYTSATWLRDAERWAALDAKLTAIQSGKGKAADAAERVQLARLCRHPYKRLYATATQFFIEAFADEPKLAGNMAAEYRYAAAGAAILAGTEQGEDAKQFKDTDQITRPDEIALYATVFDQLRQSAVYGSQARELISEAIAEHLQRSATT